MIKTAKALLAAGIFLLLGSVAGLVLATANSDPVVHDWSLVAGFGGLSLVSGGIAATLRWQSRILDRILRSQRGGEKAGDHTPTPTDLSELVRVVDSRIVGLIETLADGPANSSG